MAIEIVDFPSSKMVIFHSYVKLPEGTLENGWEFQLEISMVLVGRIMTVGISANSAGNV